jgi:hypothetical protein
VTATPPGPKAHNVTVALHDSSLRSSCVGDEIAAKRTKWAAFYDHGITQATQTGSEHGHIAYNGHPASEATAWCTPRRSAPTRGSFTASGGWDPTHALNSQGIALHAVATAIAGGVVPGGAIVSA